MFKLKLFVAFPWVVTSTGPGGFMVVCVFYDGNSRRLNRKWFYGVAYDSWLTRQRLIPYATAASHITVKRSVSWLNKSKIAVVQLLI